MPSLTINWRIGIALVLALLFVQGVGSGFADLTDVVGEAVSSITIQEGD